MRPQFAWIFFTLILFASSLACATVTNMFLPEEPDVPPTPIPQEIPTPTEAPVLENASCPALMNEIMDAALAPAQESTDYVNMDGTSIVTYEVSGDVISDPTYNDAIPADLQDEQDDITTQENVWNYFTSLIPADQREVISEYSIWTDGKDNTLASVSQSYNDPKHWILEVDIADTSDRGSLTFTLVHEFGHLLTLNLNQVPPDMDVYNNPDSEVIFQKAVDACPNYFPGEGCSNSDSYINAFYSQFWVDIHDEWDQVNSIEDENAYYEALENFYSEHEDQFVDDYAATDPVEDIAESWAFFVFNPMPGGDTIAEQKILFFYNYPELVQLRQEILNNLCKIY